MCCIDAMQTIFSDELCWSFFRLPLKLSISPSVHFPGIVLRSGSTLKNYTSDSFEMWTISSLWHRCSQRIRGKYCSRLMNFFCVFFCPFKGSNEHCCNPPSGGSRILPSLSPLPISSLFSRSHFVFLSNWVNFKSSRSNGLEEFLVQIGKLVFYVL